MFNILDIFFKPPIEPFEVHYPMLNSLDEKQLKSFKYISKQIRKGIKIDIGSNISYLYLFLFESSRELLYGCDYKKIIRNIDLLKQLYGDINSIEMACDNTLADIYFCFDEFDKFFNITSKYITGKGTCTHYANTLLNAKYKLNKEVTAQELLSIANKLTKYGKENLDEIINVMNLLIKENLKYSQETIINKIVTQELEKNSKYSLSLFCGNPYGYDLNKQILKSNYRKNYVCFYANNEFLDIIEDLSRASENIVRESKGLPRVNEGWINEVKLYYSIKNEFKSYTVIHQYRAKWLGQQSLDIFINELNIGIEYQGIQHYKPVDFFGGEEGFKKTVQRDKKKKKLCEKNDITLICFDENYSLQDVFDKIKQFDLSKI